jgi:hypothetical protein
MEIKRYLLVQWLTESRFGKTKFGFPIEIRSLMSAGIGCSNGVPESELQYEPGSADLYVFGSPKNTEGYQFLARGSLVIFEPNPKSDSLC